MLCPVFKDLCRAVTQCPSSHICLLASPDECQMILSFLPCLHPPCNHGQHPSPYRAKKLPKGPQGKTKQIGREKKKKKKEEVIKGKLELALGQIKTDHRENEVWEQLSSHSCRCAIL